ncbi:MAG TPA: glutamyl-tRNA reductase [Phnomibacter sp.]|nr:glutamyl-tRNA reductase [Phnomibacter sp.]
MKLHADHILERFCVAGISYRQANTTVRGRFAVDTELHKAILQEGQEQAIKSLFIVSTCNRTEVYGYVSHPHQLAALLCRFVEGELSDFLEHGFFLHGKSAMHHLFRVAAGLESQIIGDYEIQGQIKQSIALARKAGLIGPIMDRTLNFVFQASKKIRTNTGLSTGTVSVSFAAIEWLQQKLDGRPMKALIIGTGKFGVNVCKNMQHYLPNIELVLCNRTDEKANSIAETLKVESIPYASLDTTIDGFDIIVTSTSSTTPIVLPTHFTTQRERYIVDLSVPANVDKAVADVPGVHFANVDDISVILEQNIARRHTEVPKAESIIAEYEVEFYQWLHTYKHTPAIKLFKQHLAEWTSQNSCTAGDDISAHAVNMEELVQNSVNNLVVNLKNESVKGCHVIQAYRQFLDHPAVSVQVS